ncbi:MAG: UDP-N-acetylmuramate--L-alanine ligase [Promicromonosporaceae bacterium]|nr:UDP-N-acetylmuramate--L-alanine ligase [Promicromonosporaceae bacterium]
MSQASLATPQLAALGRVHLIGIGGAGMSVVARLLAERGVPVQGSDATDSATLQALRADGIEVWVGHDAAHLGSVDTVVISTAVRETNPELAAARARGLKVLHRSEALAALMEGQRAVAVAGAHGKTTTSALIAVTLSAAGLDPSYAIGGTIRTATGARPGGHVGATDVLIAEADESDGSFLNYAPVIAVVTNIEPDHLDHYGTQEAFEQAFVDFSHRLRPGGLLIACADDPGSAHLAATHRAGGGRTVTYGQAAAADVRLTAVSNDAGGARARLTGPGFAVDLALPTPGTHQLLNAAAAILTAIELGVPAEVAAAGAGTFLGTGRRFEHRGTVAGVVVVDDYAHHPTEVAALLAAARPLAGTGRMLALFQPHLYSRTAAFAPEFAAALAAADQVVVTGVYRAREDHRDDIGAHTVTDLMDSQRAQAVEDRLDAAHAVSAAARPGDLVLTIGAGDVTELADVILGDLGQR